MSYSCKSGVRLNKECRARKEERNNTFMAYWIIHAGWLNVYMCICSSFRNCSVLLGLALPCRSFSITSRRLESTSHFDAHRVQLSVTLETEKSSLISNINTYGRGKDESCLHFAAQSTRNVLTAARNVLFFLLYFHLYSIRKLADKMPLYAIA